MVGLIGKEGMQKRVTHLSMLLFGLCFILHKNDILVSVAVEYTLDTLNFSIRTVCLKCL